MNANEVAKSSQAKAGVSMEVQLQRQMQQKHASAGKKHTPTAITSHSGSSCQLLDGLDSTRADATIGTVKEVNDEKYRRLTELL
jgi:hypothetical protein